MEENKHLRLTEEESNFFKQKEAFYRKHRIGTALRKIIARSLQEMAVKKLLGFAGFEKNKEEAIKHHLKACKYNPCLVNNRPKFRKEVGLLALEEYKTKEVLDKINKNKERVFLKIKLRIKDLKSYFFIKNEYKKGNILNNLEFQKKYKNFYVMNMAGLTQEFFKKYFRILSNKETNLRKILNELYEIPRRKGDKAIHFSFATKLLHTVNNELPIYDSLIGKTFGLRVVGGSKKDKIDSCVLIYNNLKRHYKKLLGNKKIKKIILDFRKNFNCDRKKISDTKVLDFLIWANAQLKSKNN